MLYSSLSRNSVVSLSMSNTAIEAPTMLGASVLENRYGLLRWRSISMISFLPLVKPPLAPPSALPSVPVMISILPITLRNSCVPLPVLPRKPEEWHSSIITMASYLSARSQISSSFAMVPSMLKVPSVTMMRLRRWLVSFSFASRSCMLLCSYRKRCALHKRTPSIMLAWFNVSLMMASSSLNNGSNTPPFASKAAAYKMVSSVPRKSDSFCSSSL